jgi:hypothetical protein
MVYKASYEKREGYVFARFEGQESYEDAFKFWTDLLKDGTFKDQERFLVSSKPKKALNHNEVRMLCLEIAKMSRGKSVAYVDPNEEAFHENSYGETVAINRGRNARAFRDEKNAVEWLMENEMKGFKEGEKGGV